MRSAAFAAALKLVRTILGFSVLALGVLMIVLPGPAVVVIPIGLAILASEYAWARRYLNKFKEGGEKLGSIFFRKKEQPPTPPRSE
ncbi:MAG: PGPGW domain-containing protein [bacterium]|nr:PGPGW domain-containing protein [bacterium]